MSDTLGYKKWYEAHLSIDVPFIHSSFVNEPISFASNCQDRIKGIVPSMGISASLHSLSSPPGPIVSGSSSSAYVSNKDNAWAGVYAPAADLEAGCTCKKLDKARSGYSRIQLTLVLWVGSLSLLTSLLGRQHNNEDNRMKALHGPPFTKETAPDIGHLRRGQKGWKQLTS